MAPAPAARRVPGNPGRLDRAGAMSGPHVPNFSTKALRFLPRKRWRSLRNALASIWRCARGVTAKRLPTPPACARLPRRCRTGGGGSSFSFGGQHGQRPLHLGGESWLTAYRLATPPTCPRGKRRAPSPRRLASPAESGLPRRSRMSRTSWPGTPVRWASSSGVGSRPAR